jgi:hypothetical protein
MTLIRPGSIKTQAFSDPAGMAPSEYVARVLQQNGPI